MGAPKISQLPVPTEFLLVEKKQNLQVPLLQQNILGRESGLSTETMSRRHCQIVSKDNRWFLADLNSTNGTFLNGKKMRPHEWYSLKVGDEIEFGSLVFEFAGPLAEAEANFDPLVAETDHAPQPLLGVLLRLFKSKPRS